MPHQTRQHIVKILEQRETASARELSRLLKVTPANIRHHLSVLVSQGSLRVAGSKASQPRGRPSTVYALVQRAPKDNLDHLSKIFLKSINERQFPLSQEDAMRWLAQRLVEEFPQTAHNPTQRLYSAIQTLNRLNYHAQWEAHVDTPRIMLGHCPYASILKDHPEMCQVDTYLIEHLTGDTVRLIAKLTLTPSGQRQCVFRFIKK